MNNPYLTHELPGIGGKVRVVPEDFRVEEVPLYRPLGIGEHTYFEVEKVGLTTYEVVGRLARALRVKEGDFGLAGLKDRRAVARQVLSVQGVRPEDVLGVSLPGIRVLWSKRHVNKLRIGHLEGNRFRIRIREVRGDGTQSAAACARAIMSLLEDRGVPNFFGSQRFGVRGDNHLVGRDLVFRDHRAAACRIIGEPGSDEAPPPVQEGRRALVGGDPGRARELFPPRFSTERRVLRVLARNPSDWTGAVLAAGKSMLWLYVSAYQSHLFNLCLAQRMPDLDRVLPGDLAFKHANGAVFRVTDADAEQARADEFDISPSGPLFGRKMIEPGAGRAQEIESAVAMEEGISPRSFDRVIRGVSPKGARRALRFPLRDLEIREEGDDIDLAFFLPRGSYATSVLGELMKVDTPELVEVSVE